MKMVLHCFEMVLGLKTNLYEGNYCVFVDRGKIEDLINTLGCKVGQLHHP